nr:Hint domain-containing protein [Allgaiera sp.]
MPYIYSPDALIYDSVVNTWTLRPDYDPMIHRVEITFSDNDATLGGDQVNDEIGSDTDQTAEIRDPNGTLITSGQVYDEETYKVLRPDNTMFRIDRLEIGGQHVGFVTTDLLEPGVSYPMHEAENVYDPGGEMYYEDNRLTYAQISEVPCFLAGTSVMTEQGMVPVDWLRPGDSLLTRDRGFQSLLWVGRFELGQAGKVLPPESRPVEIEAGALGGGQPSANLCVSPQHRLLLQHAQLQLCFGHEAMFCAADFLTGWPGVNRPERRGPLIYYHLLLAHHAAVLSDGQ